MCHAEHFFLHSGSEWLCKWLRAWKRKRERERVRKWVSNDEDMWFFLSRSRLANMFGLHAQEMYYIISAINSSTSAHTAHSHPPPPDHIDEGKKNCSQISNCCEKPNGGIRMVVQRKKKMNKRVYSWCVVKTLYIHERWLVEPATNTAAKCNVTTPNLTPIKQPEKNK